MPQPFYHMPVCPGSSLTVYLATAASQVCGRRGWIPVCPLIFHLLYCSLLPFLRLVSLYIPLWPLWFRGITLHAIPSSAGWSHHRPRHACVQPHRSFGHCCITSSPHRTVLEMDLRVGVETFTLTGKSLARSTSKLRPKRACAPKTTSEREGAQHYRLADLPIYGIGRSFQTFGWVPPVTMGWSKTSGCATLWGCTMVHVGKNIVNGSKNPQFLPVMCALCVRCACCARPVRALCTNTLHGF